jgi:hypothetical protein
MPHDSEIGPEKLDAQLPSNWIKSRVAAAAGQPLEVPAA